LGYYGIAAALIPLGIGHLRLRRWARTLALAGLGFWLVVGIPMACLFMAVLVSAKEPSLLQVVAALAYFLFSSVSTIWAFSRLSWPELLSRLSFAPAEVDMLDGVPASGVHWAAFLALPLVGTIVAILYARRCSAGGS
jgi:hypothetical protein